MEIWILASVGAAFMQNLRFMLQKSLKSQLSTLGVTFSRFLFATPLAWGFVGLLLLQPDISWPGLTWTFAGYGAMMALAQIVATALLVTLFSLRNFAVGVTFSKTETVMTAILSALMLAEPVGPGAWVAILVTVVGVIIMSGLPARDNLASGFLSRAAGIGVLSGVIFALASIGVRGASLALQEGGFLIRAAVTLAFVTLFQTLVMAVWLRWREPGQIRQVCALWRVATWVGVTGMLGSLGWFIAFTLQNAAYVKALGQIELVFTILASVFFFRETPRRAELTGIILIVAGILILLL